MGGLEVLLVGMDWQNGSARGAVTKVGVPLVGRSERTSAECIVCQMLGFGVGVALLVKCALWLDLILGWCLVIVLHV